MVKKAERKPAQKDVQRLERYKRHALEITSEQVEYSEDAQNGIKHLADLTNGAAGSFFSNIWEAFNLRDYAELNPIEKKYVSLIKNDFYFVLGEFAITLSNEVSDPLVVCDILSFLERVIISANKIAPFGEKSFAPSFEIREAAAKQAAKMWEAYLDKLRPSIERRRKLLSSGPFNLEQIAASRKNADAIAKEFEAICEREGVTPVSGRQLQRDARDILEERREAKRQDRLAA